MPAPRAIDFRAMYRRSKPMDVATALPALAKEMAAIARERRAPLEQITFARDETELLQSFSTQPHHGTMRVADLKARNAVPVCLDHGGNGESPFREAACLIERKRMRCDIEADQDPTYDGVYLKVVQVAWEDDILWGTDVAGDADVAMEEELESPPVDSSLVLVPPQKKRKLDAAACVRSTEANRRVLISDSRAAVARGRKQHWGELETPTLHAHASIPHVQPVLPCALNRELDDGSWLDAIGWLSPLDMPPSKLVLDENDASLVLIEPGCTLHIDRPTLRVPVREPSAIERRMEAIQRQLADKETRLEDVCEGVRPTTKPTVKKRVPRRTVQLGPMHHSLPAIELVAAKGELSKSKLRAFHRPRGKFRPGERLACAWASPRRNRGDAGTNPIKKLSDLRPGSDGGRLVLVEYSEQCPPLLGNQGMVSRLVQYTRDASEAANDSQTMTRAFPTIGQAVHLTHDEATPFIGSIPPGETVAAMHSPLYTAPLVQHEPVAPFAAGGRTADEYDLLLFCRGRGGKSTIMELPPVFIAGQVAPKVSVPAPQSRAANDFIRAYMAFHIQRLAKQKRAGQGECALKMEEVAHLFPHQPPTAIRKALREQATFERAGGETGSGWWKLTPPSAQDADDMRASLSPEAVCLYESMMAGQRRLQDAGLRRILAPHTVQTAISRLLDRLQNRKRMLADAHQETLEHLDHRARKEAKLAIWKRDRLVAKLETDVRVARFIHEQLELTPWNLTANFVECHEQGKGTLALSGVGDPSGRGEGFSFLRESRGNATGSAPTTAPDVRSRAGTTADLRKLKKKEMLTVLRNLGVPEAKIKKLPRWDLVALIRDLSGAADAAGLHRSLSKFVRDESKTSAAQKREYHRRCDTIFKRQLDALRSTATAFDDDSLGESDLDEEDSELIDSLEEELVGENKSSHSVLPSDVRKVLTVSGGRLVLSREQKRAHEDELELARFLDDMKDAETDQSNHSRCGSVNSRPSGSEVSSAVSSPRRAVKTPTRKVRKRTTRTIHADGTESVRIEFIVESVSTSSS